ncbi:large subunit of -dimethylformamidase [Trichoderma arundinaceum]|uniref:Large subunit of-dimethylformamidase n=1 Tax=Trichoderma arundinaceum TaxID=490622 RepID=A0A395NWV4_TRIAR|nr:large subunit of -dimethylformamidase [Trichoderma arundinaceum]
MAILDHPPVGNPPEIIGYIDPWIASPGGTIDVKVSSTEPELKYHVSGTCRGRYQAAHPGSYAIVSKRDYEVRSTGLEFTLYFQPHLVNAKHIQTLVSTLDVSARRGYAALLNVEGSACSDNQVLAKWNFSLKTPSDNIVDISNNGTSAEGQLVNAPTRAVTGHDWDGMESDWTKAKYGYGAIHFHEDDLDDAAWDTDFSISLPSNLRSGVYAIEIEAVDGNAKDTVPFYIRPTEETNEALGAKVAYIISTFTYLAYANEHVFDRTHLKDTVNTTWTAIPDKHAEKTARRNDLGLSCYDIYNDRSGVVYSTAKRPILNMRPDYISWNFHRPRGLSADLLMLEFLEKIGIPYDVVCDHDLHASGKTSVSRYGTTITGSHPEYHTVESLSAYADFIRAGGNVMYLGGNGFYWSCATRSESFRRLEIRRGGEGIRPFTCPGGDRIFSSNGQSGLLWRSRGLPANCLFGVGCCAEGPGPGVPYKRTDAGKDASFAWIFDGIGEDELLGENGFGGGASGDEMDKCDYTIGSPHNTVVVATSIGHPDRFGMFPEDMSFPFQNVLGTQTKEVRSDVTYYETSGSGAVFSVGSINWLCSLGWDHFQNNIARLTENVLRELVGRHGYEALLPYIIILYRLLS